MPPKPKLHKNIGRCGISSQPGPSASAAALDPEVEQQFENEICWCIQQLQKALNSGKLTQKQILENTKALNTLMSNSSSMIKKRQVMRLSFGDYRAKMAAEDKKFSKVSMNIKIAAASPSNKSMFVKKSVFRSSNNSFKFDFKLNEENVLVDDLAKIDLEQSSNQPDVKAEKNFKFVESNNDFKFNFPLKES